MTGVALLTVADCLVGKPRRRDQEPQARSSLRTLFGAPLASGVGQGAVRGGQSRAGRGSGGESAVGRSRLRLGHTLCESGRGLGLRAGVAGEPVSEEPLGIEAGLDRHAADPLADHEVRELPFPCDLREGDALDTSFSVVEGEPVVTAEAVEGESGLVLWSKILSSVVHWWRSSLLFACTVAKRAVVGEGELAFRCRHENRSGAVRHLSHAPVSCLPCPRPLHPSPPHLECWGATDEEAEGMGDGERRAESPHKPGPCSWFAESRALSLTAAGLLQ